MIIKGFLLTVIIFFTFNGNAQTSNPNGCFDLICYNVNNVTAPPATQGIMDFILGETESPKTKTTTPNTDSIEVNYIQVMYDSFHGINPPVFPY